jgi:hypothetical protein
MSIRVLISPWGLSLLLSGVLSGALLYKRMWRKSPIFVGYSISGLVMNLGLYAVYVSSWRRSMYFEAYWLTELLGLLMGLAVVLEVFRHLFAPYPALRRLAGQTFVAAVAFLLILGCVVAHAQPSGEKNHLQAAFLVVEQATRILEAGLLLSLFAFASAFGLHWRQYVFGIALGLGVFAAVELVAVTMRVQFGITGSAVINVVRSLSFNASLLIWLGYILAPELATSPAEMPKRAQLEQWNRAVMELIYQ